MANTKDMDLTVPAVSAAGVRRWSTDDVPQSERLAYWLDAVCRNVEELEVRSPMAASFNASLVSARCGEVVMNTIEATPQEVLRSGRAIARSDSSRFFLRSTTDAPWAAGQKDGLSRMLPGDCMLFDSKQPYKMHFPGSANLISLQLPVDWVESWLTHPEAHCGVRIDATIGWGKPLSSFVQRLSPQIASTPPLPARLMTDQLGSLLALGTNDYAGHAIESGRTVAAFLRKATEILQRRYAEQGLTAQSIAGDLYVSERTLHRYFARSGTTFLQHLIKERMTVAERMLRDPRFDRINVSEIGRRVGLSDPSHFIRVCRASLGLTPSTLRRSR